MIAKDPETTFLEFKFKSGFGPIVQEKGGLGVDLFTKAKPCVE